MSDNLKGQEAHSNTYLLHQPSGVVNAQETGHRNKTSLSS